MRTTMKLLLFLMCTIFCYSAEAYDFEVDGIFYNILSDEEATCEVTFEYEHTHYHNDGETQYYYDESSTYSGDVNIPEVVYDEEKETYYTVVAIGDSAFWRCELDAVTLPTSITRIGNSAFERCDFSTFFNIPEQLEYIGEKAFYCCGGISSITDEWRNIQYIGDEAFYSSNLGGRISITPGIMWGWLSDSADYDLYIGNYAFYGTHIYSLYIEYWNGSAYDTNIFPKMGMEAFGYCKWLEEVNIVYCQFIFDGNPFGECSSLKTIKGSGQYTNSDATKGNYIVDGCLYKTSKEDGIEHMELLCCPAGKDSYDFGNDGFIQFLGSEKGMITSIGDDAFRGCDNFTEMTIPQTVQNIGYCAFMGCSHLKNIVLPNTIAHIGIGAFGQCNLLKSIKIPSSVISIGDYAFYDDPYLSEIHLTPNENLTIGLRSPYIYSDLTLYLYKTPDNSQVIEEIKSKYIDRNDITIIELTDYSNNNYTLNVSDAGMSTLYLDFPIEIPNNDDLLGVFYVNKIEGKNMRLKKVKDVIPANTGVIIMANSGSFTLNGTNDKAEVITDNQLSGVTERTPVSDIDGTVYTLGRGVNSGYMGFHKFTGTTIPANKAFLVRNASTGVNSFNLVLDNEDGTSTAIGRIENGEFTPENNVVYDLQGRRVENPSKGIYIVNGKKQYIK